MGIKRFVVMYSPEGTGGINGASEPDFDSIADNFDKNYQPEETEQVESLDPNEIVEDEDEEVDEDEDEEEVDFDDDEDEEEYEDEEVEQEFEEEEEPQHDPDEERRNQAFANLRRQAQENQRYADFVKQLAETSGTTPEEVIQRLEDIKMQEKAEKDGVSIEVARRLTQLEEENKQAKLDKAEIRFNSQVEKVVEKYGATEQDLDEAYRYAMENGLDLVGNEKLNFDTVFRAAHLDTIVESQIHRARQKDLSSKKKRQAQSPLPNGTGSNNADGDLLSQATKDAQDFMANW